MSDAYSGAPSAEFASVVPTKSDQGSRPDWAQRLPAPLRWLFDFLYFKNIDPTEDFDSTLRKLVFGTVVAIAPFPTAYPVYYLITLDRIDTTGEVITIVSTALYVLVWLCCFARVKAVRGTHENTFDFFVFGTWVGLILQAISLVRYPNQVNFAQLAMVSLTCRTPRTLYFMPVLFFSYVLAAYNEASYAKNDHPRYPLAAVPDPLVPTSFFECIRDQLTSLSVFLLLFACLELQLREARRMNRAARASVVVASDLAEALCRYDTLEAERLIDDARRDGTTDTVLLASFAAIIENLNRYRPHLPNWLIASETVVDASDDEAEDMRSNKAESARVSARSSRSLSSNNSIKPITVKDRDGFAGGGLFALHDPLVCKVTMAFIEFTVMSPAEIQRVDKCTGTLAKMKQAQASHAFVDRVHQLAAQTIGAVHSFVGDRVIVSWNAASSTLQPEVKGTRFVAALKQDSGHSLVRVWGCVIAGEGRVHLAGLGRQQAFTLSLSVREKAKLNHLSQIASRFEIFVTDAVVEKGSNFVVEQRPIGIHRLPRSKFHDGNPDVEVLEIRADRVYQLLAERAENNDEWLYVLDRQNTSDALVAAALLSSSAGDFAAALQTLENIDAARRNADPVLSALMHDVEDALSRSAKPALEGSSASHACGGWLVT
jgi:hypothetical protein